MFRGSSSVYIVNFIEITEETTKINDIKIEILIIFLTLTYDFDPQKNHQFVFRGSSSVYIVNFIVITEETTKIEILLKIGQISEFVVRRTFNPCYPKSTLQYKTPLAMCPVKMKTIWWILFQFCWTNHDLKHSTYLTFVTLTFKIGQKGYWWLLQILWLMYPVNMNMKS